jgi:hypothetical protein
MVQNFLLITNRTGSAKHILDIGFGATDQTTFGQLALDINFGNRGVLCTRQLPRSLLILL